MIPKIIHYCWFGENPKPKIVKKCIRSWKRYCPDYKIIEWNEKNFDLGNSPKYVRQAYDAKKWAFVTDYVRLKVVYEQGGIYLDTDVELIKNLDDIINEISYFGFENGKYINTGLGFGSEAKTDILKSLIDDYHEIEFLKVDGNYDLTPCPIRNTEVFKNFGLIQNDSKQILNESILILPSSYLCPQMTVMMKPQIQPETLSIHWFEASWLNYEGKKHKLSPRREARKDFIAHLPNRILNRILGNKLYGVLKRIFGR